MGRDVGYPALTLEISTASEALRLFDAAENIASAVTFGAMPGPLDQVGTAIIPSVSVGIGDERLALEEEELPDAYVPANIERKRQRVRLGRRRLGWHGLQKRVEVTYVVA